MRFPTVDDAAGILQHAEDEVEEAGGMARFSMLYDVSRAHKLLPVKERDWGLQAFRLPGDDEDWVYLHTRGTFGIASAAYWWQRLAACLVRLGHNISGLDLGILHLLFADDGWMLAMGAFFWRRLLFWLFVLDLCEVPLSWKKVRGGTVVQWIGYQLDVDLFKKGISERKVKWMLDWLEKHEASGGILGRDLKSALGRFGFVAGALQHVRPFLGPIFAWSARLAPGTYAKFPDAIQILLRYVMKQVKDIPMSKPRRIRDHVREAFRVDAKAEGELIVIGGWEVMDGQEKNSGRWFSIELNRRNAPWAYLKGEPFRNIASLELCAVLVAVMFFGDRLVDTSCRNRLVLTASTDNLGNTYVLQHFMSCKYPLSIVVMELAVQLQKLGLELELGWIPRGQNEEADALTNKEFGGFDMEKRIQKNFEDVKFMVLDELMEKAGQLDAEIKLAKSSKEAKGDRPVDTGVYVGGLNFSTTSEALKAHFEQFGQISDCVVMTDRDSGRSRGFGFVTFEDPGSVNAAITMPTQQLDGRNVTVKKATREGSRQGGGGAEPEGVEFNVVKVFVGGLPPSVDYDKLTGYFEKYGSIEDAVVMIDPGTQRSRGFGFVTFKDSSSVEACMQNYNSNEIDGKWIEVKRCIPQDKMAPGQGKGKSKGKPPSYSNGSSPGGSGGYPPNYGHGYPPGGPPGYGGFGPAPGPYGVYQGCGGYGYPPYGQGYAPGTPGTPGTPGYGAPGYGGYGAYPAYPPVDSRSAPY
eukprot:s382_g23.t1